MVNSTSKGIGFVYNFYPGVQIRTPKTEDKTIYLTFPKLLFDYSSPFNDAHTYCRGEDEKVENLWKPKIDVFFESGQKKAYNFNCTVREPDKLKSMFYENILFNISGFSPTPNSPVCLLQVDKDKINYLKGFKLIIPATPIGFSDLFFQVQFCSATPMYSNEMIKDGTEFEQIVVLDVTPTFMGSSVYLFLGMAIFSLVLSCLIISAIIHRWKNTIPDFENEIIILNNTTVNSNDSITNNNNKINNNNSNSQNPNNNNCNNKKSNSIKKNKNNTFYDDTEEDEYDQNDNDDENNEEICIENDDDDETLPCDNENNENGIELKSIHCDISYKTYEEKIQYYLNKIDTFFNIPPQNYYIDQHGNNSLSVSHQELLNTLLKSNINNNLIGREDECSSSGSNNNNNNNSNNSNSNNNNNNNNKN
ncbi:hypothetical protein ACTFIW_009874 [Dictyostelium discoideum]